MDVVFLLFSRVKSTFVANWELFVFIKEYRESLCGFGITVSMLFENFDEK